jgi:hypothetical protein
MLKKKKVSVDVATKQQLLDLVCYHNEREEMGESHGDTAGVIQVPENPWYEGNAAEKIYQVRSSYDKSKLQENFLSDPNSNKSESQFFLLCDNTMTSFVISRLTELLLTLFCSVQDITGDKKATEDDLSAANLSILYGMAKHKQRKEAWIYYEMTKVCRLYL